MCCCCVARFYDVESGAVLVGGQDVKQVQMASLRHAMASVPQDMVLFNDTIFYNIAYGNLGASKADVEAAAKAAQVCLPQIMYGLNNTYATAVLLQIQKRPIA